MISITAKNFIDGGWQEAVDCFQSLDPADRREVVGTAPRSTQADVDAAVNAADRSFRKWRDMGAARRSESIDSFAQVMKRYGREIAKYLTRETGKPVAEATAEVQDALAVAQLCAGMGRSVHGFATADAAAGLESHVMRRPRGVIACITPAFSPVALPLRLVLSSLVAGNTVVWKPSEDAPVCAQWLSRLFLEAGILEGAVNILHGPGETSGASLCAHGGVAGVLFAGAGRNACALHGAFAGDLKRSLSLEAAGVGAAIVLQDADLEAAATAVARGAFRTSGQRLDSIDRIYVDASVESAFTEVFAAKARALTIGPGCDPEVTMGALVSAEARSRWTALRDEVLAAGADVVYDGGDPTDGIHEHGCYATPFVWRCPVSAFPTPERAEARCPHVAIVPIEDLEQAVESYNVSLSRSTLAVFTEDRAKVRWVRENASFANGYVNTETRASEAQTLAAGHACYGSGQAGLPAVQSAISRNATLIVG